MGTLGWERFRIRSQRLSTVNAMDSAHIIHTSHAAARALIPPASRPCCSLASSVTTSLYSTTVSQALRGGVVSELPRTLLPGAWVSAFPSRPTRLSEEGALDEEWRDQEYPRCQ